MSAQSKGISFIPEAIIFNILTRLPVKSICRFKCVCKAWISIISSPPFVDSHAALSKSQPKLLVAVYRDESRYLFIGDQTLEQEGNPPVVLRQSITMPVKKFSVPWHLIPHVDSQSVGGLMLSICSQDLIRLANPSINKCDAFSPQQNYSPSFPDSTRRYISLGFDPVEGKHKLLESISIWGRSVDSSVERTEHRVVTVDDKAISWRYVKDGPTINRGPRGGHEICVNGVIYFTTRVIWYSRGIEVWEQCIVAFDVRTESFQVVKLPVKERFQFHYSINPWIYVEFEGKVAIVDYPLRDRRYHDIYELENALGLWVLEDSLNHVWSLKFFNLPTLSLMMMENPFRPERKLVGTTLDGELVFAIFDRRIYDTDEIFNETEEKGVPISFFFFDMKTGDSRKSEVCFPEGFVLTDNVKITVMGHVEKLLSIVNESEYEEFGADYANTLALLSTVKV